MEMPILYENDKVSVGPRGFMAYGFTPLVDVLLGGAYEASEEYQTIFSEKLKAGGLIR